MASVVKELIEYVGISNKFPEEKTVKIFKEIMSHELIKLNECNEDIEQITRVIVDVEILNSYIIQTPIASKKIGIINPSGQIVTGNKLIIEGVIHQLVQYVGNDCDNKTYSLNCDHNFVTYAVLPKNNEKISYEIKPYVEDVIIKKLDLRHFFKCVTVFLEVE